MRTVLLRIILATIAAGALAVTALAAPTAAHASTPVQFKFTETISFTDTITCGFPIALNFQFNAVGRVFLDAQGNFQSMTIEQSVVGTDSANGITLRENDHFVDFLNSIGTDKEVGLPIHIQGGGVVIRDAGYILFNPDGSVAYIHGPHPFLEGDTAAYCAALS
jgi:hypothetical protein